MKVVVDACVLYPTILRQLVLGVAAEGWFTPIWSSRILGEWRRAAMKCDPGGPAIAKAEIAAANTMFPDASLEVGDVDEDSLSLPDPDDIHVLATAIGSAADAILTLNLRDFPRRTLARHRVMLRHPDEFLLEAHVDQPDMMRGVVDDVLERAGRHGIDVSNPRALFRRARLPRLGKALGQS